MKVKKAQRYTSNSATYFSGSAIAILLFLIVFIIVIITALSFM